MGFSFSAPIVGSAHAATALSLFNESHSAYCVQPGRVFEEYRADQRQLGRAIEITPIATTFAEIDRAPA